MKTILVTGGAGLIGSRLCRRLVSDGHRVISLDNYFAGSRDNHVSGVEYREGHTKDIEKHVSEDPDVIFHLGEYARVEQSVLEPEVVEDLNTVGTAGVIEFWKKSGCKLVYAGSSTKFGNEGWDKGAVPYVRTKAENTERVKKVGEEKGLPYAITYFYNVYGPGERAGVYGTVIEAFRQMYVKGEPLAVTSPGTQRRNFTHVDDIVDGLLVVAEKGQCDEYGLGCEESWSIREEAELFGGEVVMLPARSANRAESSLDVGKTKALGWEATRSLKGYIEEFIAAHERGQAVEKRVLVFSTTFLPVVGPAERALVSLMEAMPELDFDVVTTRFKKDVGGAAPGENVRVHRVGFGNAFDKFLLPVLGAWKARRLCREHRYLFCWSIMASYAALAAVFTRRKCQLPLLVTLADQRFSGLPLYSRLLLRTILSDADQVYGISSAQEGEAAAVAARSLERVALGRGDAFANQIRYAYADLMREEVKSV